MMARSRERGTRLTELQSALTDGRTHITKARDERRDIDCCLAVGCPLLAAAPMMEI